MVNLLLVYGCGTTMKPVRFRLLANSNPWVVSDAATYLVVIDKNWSNYYSSVPPGSDFATYIYLVASRGVKPNPGYRIRIMEVRQLKDTVTIKLELKEPDPRKVYPQIIVHPVAVTEIAKGDLEPCDILNFVFIDQKGRELVVA